MNDQQAASLGKLLQQPKYAQLQELCNELGQAQQDATSGSHDAIHAQMVSYSNSAVQSMSATLSPAPTKQGLGAAPPSNGLGDTPPTTPSSGYGDTPPTDPSSGYGDTPPASSGDDSEFNPANWDVAKNGVDYYVNTLYYLYDKLRTTDSDNPNDLIYFLEGLSKLSQYGGSERLDQFTQMLCQQTGALNNSFLPMSDLTSKTSPQSFSTLVAFAIVTLSIYQVGQTGGSMADVTAQVEQYLGGPLSGNNAFLVQVRSALSAMLTGPGLQLTPVPGQPPMDYNIASICSLIFQHDGCSYKNGVPVVSKVFLQHIIESLFGGAQGTTDPEAISNAQAAVRQAFSQNLLNQLEQKEADGESTAELIDFTMMQYNLASDDAGAYVGDINDLAGLEGDASQVLGLFSPGKYVNYNDPSNIADFESHVSAYYRLMDMWPTAPNVAGGGEGSLQDILTGQLKDAFNSLTLNKDVLGCLTPPPTITGNTVHWRGLQFPVNASFGSLMTEYKGVLLGDPNSAEAKNVSQLMVTLIGRKNHEPEQTAPGDTIYKRDGQLDTIVSSLQAVESQVSSANETAKAEYQQANQVSANLLSTGGDMMKDLAKMSSTSVQNEKAGA